MALKVARRASIPPFIAMEMLRAANARAAAGERVLHLELGQPDGGAPQAVIEAATRGPQIPSVSAIPRRSASRPCAPRSRRITAIATASIWIRGGWW